MELYTGYGETDLKMLSVQTGIFFDTVERPSTDARISSQPEVLFELRTWKTSVCVLLFCCSLFSFGISWVTLHRCTQFEKIICFIRNIR